MTTAVATPVSITHFPPAEVYDGEINTEVHGAPEEILNASLNANPEDSTPYTFSNGVVMRTNHLYCSVYRTTKNTTRAVQAYTKCSFRIFYATYANPSCPGHEYPHLTPDMTRHVAVTLDCEVNPQSELAQNMCSGVAFIEVATRIASVHCQLISSYAHESPAAIAHACMLDILMKAQLTRLQPDSGLKVALSADPLIHIFNENNLDVLDENNTGPLTLTDRFIRWPLLIDRLIRWPLSQQAQAPFSGSAGSGGAAAAATPTSGSAGSGGAAAAAATSTSGSAGSGAATPAATPTNNMPFHRLRQSCKTLTQPSDFYSFTAPFGPDK